MKVLILSGILGVSFKATAFPIYAQNAYANPREANGRIACANCHLAQKPTGIESPSAVLPDTVFEAVVKIPYDLKKKQLDIVHLNDADLSNEQYLINKEILQTSPTPFHGRPVQGKNYMSMMNGEIVFDNLDLL